jgi:hypothetical protein
LFNTDGSGSFGAPADYRNPDGASALACADLDGANGPDVVAVNPGSDNLTIFLNAGGGVLQAPPSLIPIVTEPSDAEAADLDGDEHIDLAASFSDGVAVFANDCGSVCGDGACESPENECNCPDDCGPPAPNEEPDVTCNDGINNDCDGSTDCDDPDCTTDVLCSGGCLSDEHCDDGTICTWDRCIDQSCSYESNAYGDVDHSDTLNLFDIFCVLKAMNGDYSDCGLEDADIEPCVGNGILNLFDVFAVLDAMIGIDPCCA